LKQKAPVFAGAFLLSIAVEPLFYAGIIIFLMQLAEFSKILWLEML
jgi:hypothetical protein